MNFPSVSSMTDIRLCPLSSNLFCSRKFKTSSRGLNLFSKLYERIPGWRMIYCSSQPASSIRNVILSDMLFFESVQTPGFFLSMPTMSGWDQPKLFKVAKVASNLDLLMFKTATSA
ncbi:unnamed protein product [Musa acuminata subsp. burmannicoides]